MNIDSPSGDRAVPAKVLVVEDRETQLQNVAAQIEKVRATVTEPDQLAAVDRMERRVKRALGIRRLRPQLVVGQDLTVTTEYDDRVERVLKIKADGSLRVTREDMEAEAGEIVQLDAMVNGVMQLTDYVVTSHGADWTALRLLSPAEIEARKAEAARVVFTSEPIDIGVPVDGQFRCEPVFVGPSASQLARRARKTKAKAGRAHWKKYKREQRDREQAMREFTAVHEAGRAEAAGADGLPAHAEAA